jgi:hypothetical protein
LYSSMTGSGENERNDMLAKRKTGASSCRGDPGRSPGRPSRRLARKANYMVMTIVCLPASF